MWLDRGWILRIRSCTRLETDATYAIGRALRHSPRMLRRYFLSSATHLSHGGRGLNNRRPDHDMVSRTRFMKDESYLYSVP